MRNTLEQVKNYNQFSFYTMGLRHDSPRNVGIAIYLFDIQRSTNPEVQEVVQFVEHLMGRGSVIIKLFSVRDGKACDQGGLLIGDWFDGINPIDYVKLKTCRKKWIDAIIEDGIFKSEKSVDKVILKS